MERENADSQDGRGEVRGQAEPRKQERMTGASSPSPDTGINSCPPPLSSPDQLEMTIWAN